MLFSFSVNQEVKKQEIQKLAQSHMARSDKARIKNCIFYYHQLRFHRFLSQDIKFFPSWDSF